MAENPGMSRSEVVADTWRFRVYLDDREIGFHHFFLTGEGESRQMRSEATFEIRLLFVTLFDYRHENQETWSGNCLQSIRSRTDANGQSFSVNGRREGNAFHVRAGAGAASLPECVMSFAYWNPVFLEQPRLLNTQDGQFLDVAVSLPVPEQRLVNGQMLQSYRYRLVAGDMKIDLWYSEENVWLALESEVAGGRLLRYEPDTGGAS